MFFAHSLRTMTPGALRFVFPPAVFIYLCRGLCVESLDDRTTPSPSPPKNDLNSKVMGPWLFCVCVCLCVRVAYDARIIRAYTGRTATMILIFVTYALLER